MIMKHYKPTTSSRRGMIGTDFSDLTKKKGPQKSLTKKLDRSFGRGYKGRITCRHKGGGHKRRYRLIDFNQTDKMDIPAKVVSIEYDPNRSSFIALVNYKDGEKRYILAYSKLKVGDEVMCQENAPIKIGNRLKLKNIVVGTEVYNIEMNSMQGGKLVRSAGNTAQVLAIDGKHCHLKLPSSEVRMVNSECFASIGQLSNIEHNTIVLGKAGKSRWMGKRPTVRGSAMNPCDHAHGGGENKQSIGLRRGPKTPWGKLAFGVKTRKKKKPSSKFIIKRRKSKRKK
ncbi:MAG: 50S ribosomal protein L2 [bacterium]